jgi:hypothetical protein
MKGINAQPEPQRIVDSVSLGDWLSTRERVEPSNYAKLESLNQMEKALDARKGHPIRIDMLL